MQLRKKFFIIGKNFFIVARETFDRCEENFLIVARGTFFIIANNFFYVVIFSIVAIFFIEVPQPGPGK